MKSRLCVIKWLGQLTHVHVARRCLNLSPFMHKLLLLVSRKLESRMSPILLIGSIRATSSCATLAESHIGLDEQVLEHFLVIIQGIEAVDILELVLGFGALGTCWAVSTTSLVKFGGSYLVLTVESSGNSLRLPLNSHIPLWKLPCNLLLSLRVLNIELNQIFPIALQSYIRSEFIELLLCRLRRNAP